MEARDEVGLGLGAKVTHHGCGERRRRTPSCRRSVSGGRRKRLSEAPLAFGDRPRFSGLLRSATWVLLAGAGVTPFGREVAVGERVWDEGEEGWV